MKNRFRLSDLLILISIMAAVFLLRDYIASNLGAAPLPQGDGDLVGIAAQGLRDHYAAQRAAPWGEFAGLLLAAFAAGAAVALGRLLADYRKKLLLEKSKQARKHYDKTGQRAIPLLPQGGRYGSIGAASPGNAARDRTGRNGQEATGNPGGADPEHGQAWGDRGDL